MTNQKPKTFEEAAANLRTAMAEFVTAFVAAVRPAMQAMIDAGYMSKDGKLTAKGKKLMMEGKQNVRIHKK